MRHWRKNSVPSGLISGEKKLEIVKRPLIPVLFFFIFGIVTGRVLLSYHQYIFFPLILLITAILLFSIILQRPYFRLIFFFLMFFLIGACFVLYASINPPRLLELTEGRKNIILEGTVLSPEIINQERSRFDLSVDSVFIDQAIITLKEKVSVTIYKNIVDLEPGQRIRFPASLRPFQNFNNPGRYDYKGNMGLRGYSCRASVSDGRYIVPMGKGETGLLMKAMEAARAPIRRFITDNLSRRNGAVYRALILGEMQGIDNDLRESFNITGLGHVLSVSGMHVGLVAVVCFALFRFLFSRSYSLMLRIDIRKLAAIVTCICVFAYTFIAGFQVSAKRAMIMAIIYLLSMVIGREKDSWSTLALAAIIVLALDPNDLFNISFQLSFIAVIGIFWLSPEVYRLAKATFKDSLRGSVLSHIYIYFSSLLVITLSAVIFLLPVTTYYFYRVSVIAVPINLIVEPVLGLWILPLGLLSTVLLPVSYTLASLILKTGSLGLDIMMNIIDYWSGFRWTSFWSVTPSPFEIVLSYGIILFFIFALKGRTWAKTGLLLAIIISVIDLSWWAYEIRMDRDLRVTFIDVGQGNSALVQLPGKERILIDGGGFMGSSYDTGRMIVAPFLFRSKIHRIDYIVLSHPHPDHLNGLNFIAEHFHPKEFWYNGQDAETTEFVELMQTVKKNGARVLSPDELSQGREIAGVKIELLHPVSVDISTNMAISKDDSGSNNNSLVLKMSYKGRSFLFPGDIEKLAEAEVVAGPGERLKSDVLLVPHHGSKTSSTEAFINAVRPEISVISCGKGNSFKFPHEQTIKRLKDAGSTIIRIDESGAVRIRLSEEGLRIKRFID
jgi:competence protein ComEC